MAEKRFTPGPWKLADDGSPFIYRLNGEGINRMAATVHHCWMRTPVDPREVMANAHLMCAAPELYEALEATVAALASSGSMHQKALDAAEAALAKSRGGTP